MSRSTPSFIAVFLLTFCLQWSLAPSSQAQESKQNSGKPVDRTGRVVLEFGPAGNSKFVQQMAGSGIRGVEAASPIGRDAATAYIIDPNAIAILRETYGVVGVVNDEPQTSRKSVNVLQQLHGGSYGSTPFFESGAGLQIAVIDNGIIATHPMLRGKVAKQACFSVNDPRVGGHSCPTDSVILADNTAVSEDLHAAEKCASDSSGRDMELCLHGTHVAATAAGRAVKQDSVLGLVETKTNTEIIAAGLAPASEIVAVQVFNGNGVSTFPSAYLRALTWVGAVVEEQIALSKKARIAAVVMALGGGEFKDYCDDFDAFTRLTARRIKWLREIDVAVFVAAGNHGWSGSVTSPGCIKEAITIGATNSKGEIMPWSNRNTVNGRPMVSFFAPGNDIVAAAGRDKLQRMSGTSMAAGVAAGSYLAIKSAVPEAHADVILAEISKRAREARDPLSNQPVKEINLSATRAALIALKQAEGSAPAPASKSGGLAPVLDGKK